MIGLVESLFRCSEFSATEIPQFEHMLKSRFGATGFDLADRSDVRLRNGFVKFHDIEVGFWVFGTATRIALPPHDAAVLGLALQGAGAVVSGSQTALASHPTLASGGRPLKLQYGADLKKVFVRFESDALKRKLSVLLGAPVNGEPEFKISEFTSREMLNGLIGLVKMLVHQIDNPEVVISPITLRELEDAVVVQLLLTGRHRWSNHLDRKPLEASSNSVARAEQFIEANWNQPITMETLTEVTGVSGRTLFRSFTKARGYSPMVFARKVRLERVRDLLSRPDADTTVTGVALACGFSNLGRFAQNYWTMFGELPSKTLNRSLRKTGSIARCSD